MGIPVSGQMVIITIKNRGAKNGRNEAKSKFDNTNPIVNKKEREILDLLTERYSKLIKQSKALQAVKTIGSKIETIVPATIKSFGSDIASNMSSQEIYKRAMELVMNGFKVVEEQAAKYSINDNTIIRKVSKTTKDNHIKEFSEICFARSYNISKLVDKYKTQDIFLAFTEGGATGVFGFWGLPFNLVLSTFLYFRAVQSIAMFYGYDVKNNMVELLISSEVFTRALSPSQQDANNEFTAVIGKIMMMSQASLIKNTAKKTWSDMAVRGGIPLLITQMRALAHKTAKKALEKTGAKSLEHSLFKEALEQIGKKLTLKALQKGIPVASAGIGALIDAAQMNKVLEYADVFYQKRFILEKEGRIFSVLNADEITEDYDIVDNNLEAKRQNEHHATINNPE